jgi:FSR family fosmidomycin resistance protein-like MFS transporter
VLSFEMSRRGHGEAATGLVQSLFLVSASVGMMFMALKFRSGWEKRFMILCPLAGIPLLFLLGLSGCPEWLFIALLVPTGFVLWGTTPAMVSYGQELFPNAAGVASAITMGISWGVGGLLQAPITAYFQNSGAPYLAYHAFIVPVLCGAIGAWLLPSTSQELAATELPAAAGAEPQMP